MERFSAKHSESIFFKQENIDSSPNEFEFIEDIIKDLFDMFLISESKLNVLVSKKQFYTDIYRKYRNEIDGSLIFDVNHHFNCKILNTYSFH